MVAIAGNILSSMMDAFASIISNNLNVVMKFLASMTIILSIPTIITSYFGMNVDLPLQNNRFAHIWIIVIFLGLSMSMIYLFIRKKWF